LGLHASDDLAFHRDFEAVHSCSRRLTLNNAAPDILNSNRGTDFVNGQTPFFLDGWQSSGEYIGLTGESPFSLESTWKLIWDQKVSFIVTLLTSVAKDDPWYQAFMRAANKHELEIAPRIFPAGTDSRYIREVGIPAFGFSPMNNTPVLLHDHNEFLNEKVFLRGIDIFCDIIAEMANV